MALNAVAEILSAGGIRKRVFNGSSRSAAENVGETGHQNPKALGYLENGGQTSHQTSARGSRCRHSP